MLETVEKTELNQVITEGLTVYKDLNDYVTDNNLDIDDFTDWMKQGFSDDGFVQIDTKYWLAGNATTGDFLTITNKREIADLIFKEIKACNFYETIKLLNEDATFEDELININDPVDVVRSFFEYCQEIAIFPNQEKNGYILVFNED